MLLCKTWHIFYINLTYIIWVDERTFWFMLPKILSGSNLFGSDPEQRLSLIMFVTDRPFLHCSSHHVFRVGLWCGCAMETLLFCHKFELAALADPVLCGLAASSRSKPHWLVLSYAFIEMYFYTQQLDLAGLSWI